MYKCKECGAEYEEKPDYCDCGNDEFEEVGVKIEEKIVETETPVIEKPKPTEAKSFRTPMQDNYIPKREFNIDPISLSIFIVCILLSIYVLFFAFNPKESDENAEVKQEMTTIPKNIPAIDKIWNNALPVVKKEEPKKVEPEENIIKQIIPVQTQQKAENKKQTTMKKVTTVPLKKSNQIKNNVSTKQQIIAQEQAKKAADEKAKKEALAKQKAEAERKAAEDAQIKKLKAEQAKKAAEEKAQKAQVAKQELVVYKANLRNTIARKIDFTRVIGDGSCTVSFKIDSNGRFYNRSFTKQSSNNTLNDAVYNAIMATPSFNPPPEAYNNEVLSINIKFYNGNFEISLP